MNSLMRYLDRKGNPLDLYEWGRLLEDPVYKRVAETTLPDGKWVSTVWMGLDHGFGGDRPLIFETMVFATALHGSESLDCERFSTEEEAKAGHQEVVERWRRLAMN